MASPTSPDDDTHSIANSTSSPPSLPAWHFPFGPSSKYHQRERPRKPAQHTRNNSSTFTPRGPRLATEQRSHHRRAHTSLPSPPSTASDYSQSPLGRFTGGVNPMAHHHPLPTTPAKACRRRNSSVFHDSPFSDYFTDPDARSLAHAEEEEEEEEEDDDEHIRHAALPPPTATQQLLVRMNKLQSQLIRDSSPASSQPNPNGGGGPNGDEEDAIAIVGRHLTSLEGELAALSTRSRYAPELMDSGLFLRSEDYPPRSSAVSTVSSSTNSSSGSASSDDPALTITHLRAERDYFLLETQRLLTGLRAAQTQLRARCEELRDLHERQAEETAGLEERNSALNAENAQLRADLAGDAGELLGLKVLLSVYRARLEKGEFVDGKAVKGLGREMEKWRIDWEEVDERFRRRRAERGIVIGDGGDEEEPEETDHGKEKASWGVEMTKTVDGRMTSVTIKRVGFEGEEEEEEEEEEAVDDVKTYAEQGTQTQEVPVVSTLPTVPASDADEHEGALSDDCAITTSSERSTDAGDPEDTDGSEDPGDDETEDRVETPRGTRTPWQELWDGLTKLAGMDESHF